MHVVERAPPNARAQAETANAQSTSGATGTAGARPQRRRGNENQQFMVR